MSAPVIWIIFPLLVTVILWIIRNQESVAAWIASGICLILFLLAGSLPIDQLFRLGFISINISSTLVVLGRKFTLPESERMIISLVYGMGFLWMLAVRLIGKRRNFPAAGLASMALLLAALSVEPFFYSALLIEVAVLVSIPNLVPQGGSLGKGILRFLIFQTLAVPLILLAGWITGIMGANPADQSTLIQVILFISLGFAFWLGIFPFYSWIPMVAEEADPFPLGFLLSLLPSIILLQAVKFIDGFIWLRESTLIFSALRISGLLMVVAGGIWAVVQKDLRRLFAFGVILETGFSLLAIGIRNWIGLEYFAMSIVPRMISMFLWSLAMSQIHLQDVTSDYEGFRGFAGKSPVVASAIIVSLASFAGIPLMGSFPLRIILLQSISRIQPLLLTGLIIGVTCFIAGILRFLKILLDREQETTKSTVSKPVSILLVAIMIISFLIGVFPRLFLSGSINILGSINYLP